MLYMYPLWEAPLLSSSCTSVISELFTPRILLLAFFVVSEGCREVFGTFSAFNSHIYCYHRAEVGINSAPKSRLLPHEPEPSHHMDCNDGVECTTQVNHTHGVSDFLLKLVNIMDKSLQASIMEQSSSTDLQTMECCCSTCEYDCMLITAKMLLKLRGSHHVSQVAMII